MELRTLFEAIKRLISTPGAVDGCLDPGKALTEQLKSNIAGYRNFLSLSRCIELSRRLEYHRSFGGEGHVFPKENEEDPTLATYNEFTTEALALVHVLDTLLCTLHEEDKATSNKTRPGEQPSPPSALLSISENKTLRGMFEFVVALGIYPYLLPGVDTSVRLKFNRAESVSKAFHLSSASKNALLYLSCSGIAKCFKNEVIGASLLARHLSDVLIAMIQACYSPKPEDEKEKIPTRKNCRQLLKNVLKETHQPLVVRELLVLQGMPSPGSGGKAGVISSRSPTPKWLRGACGKLLSERLMSKNGVQNVLNGIMEVTSGGGCSSVDHGVDWRKCKAVARIISTCPSQAITLEDYYSLVCPQILELVTKSSRSQGHYTRIGAETISNMMMQNMSLSEKYLLVPLTEPLSYLLKDNHELAASRAEDIQECLFNLHKICMVVEPSSMFLTSLFRYLPLLFGVWRSGFVNDKLSDCIQNIMERILKNSSSSEIIDVLCYLCNIPNSTATRTAVFLTQDPRLVFSCTGNPPTLSITSTSDLPKLSTMESIGQHIVRLLHLDLNSEEIVGKFFIKCIDYLAVILGESMRSKKNSDSKLKDSGNSSSVLLECERALPKSSSELISETTTLYVAASLCEHMSECILKQSHFPSLLEACRTIVACHARIVDERERILTSEPLPREERILGGPVTLNIAFGILSAILSEAKEVKQEYRHLLTAMTPSLSTIATEYQIDPDICGLAGDLNVWIKTLGAAWSMEVKECGSRFKSGGKLSKGAKSGMECLSTDGREVSLFQEALRDLKDPQIPTRGHALISLTKLVNSKDVETLNNTSVLLTIFKDNLSHSDSYVYLAAINGLVALALSAPLSLENVLLTLCHEYAGLSGRPDVKGRLKYDREEGRLRTRNIKEMSKYDVETRMKLGEALVRVSRELKDMLPHFLDDVVASLLTAVRDPEPLIRTSGLTNIAEICGSGKMVVTSIITEVLSCVEHVLRSDKNASVRQASLVVLKHIIMGSAVQDSSEFMLDIYRLLKQIEGTELDELTRAHAQAALGEMDKNMRAFIFPEERKMEKKITVLN